MEGNMNFAEGMKQAINQICELVKEEPLANTVVLSSTNNSESMKAGFEILVAAVSVQSGRKLKAVIEAPTNDYMEGAIHLAFINDGTQNITLKDVLQNR